MDNEICLVLRASGSLAMVRSFAASVDWLQGDIVVRKPGHHQSGLPEAWWYVETRLLNQDSTAPAFLSLAEMLLPGVEGLSIAIAKNQLLIEIDCAIKRPSGTRIEMPNEAIAVAAKIGASISVDLY